MTDTVVHHPAKFTDDILDAIAELLPDRDLNILDPFAGVGRVHRLRGRGRDRGLWWNTEGVELEPEWANQHTYTREGNSLNLAAPRIAMIHPFFDAIVTSPCYGNRMADKYDGSGDRCVECRGEGRRWRSINTPMDAHYYSCPDCNGTGFKPSRRHTYRIDLGRDLSPGSSANLQWGRAYKIFHRRAWAEATRVCKPGAVFVLNIKDHVRKGKVARVTDFHISTLTALGWRKTDEILVGAPGNRHGENHELRMEYESVIRFDLEVTF